MNRQIKFRGKRIDNGEWVYGYVFFDFRKSESAYIRTINSSSTEEVIPETVGQFTGLLDKNGKEIYEGDFIKYNDYMYNFDWNQKHIGVIEWRDNAALFRCTRIKVDEKSVKTEYGLTATRYNTSEVIGNIHDAPDLLTTKKEKE